MIKISFIPFTGLKLHTLFPSFNMHFRNINTHNHHSRSKIMNILSSPWADLPALCVLHFSLLVSPSTSYCWSRQTIFSLFFFLPISSPMNSPYDSDLLFPMSISTVFLNPNSEIFLFLRFCVFENDCHLPILIWSTNVELFTSGILISTHSKWVVINKVLLKTKF